MTVPLLDINDCLLQLWGSGPLQQSPGYALLEGRDYRFGNSARGSARLRPRDINNRFWWQLSVEPLQPALGPARHTADLVHAHLKQIHRDGGEPPELLLACSGSMQREQLSLLLGIVQQCPFEVVGLVNRSALLASLHGGPGRLFHLELQLHQALLTELAQNGEDMLVQRSVPLPGCGLLQLQERLVEVIASAFIRQTRFDPRRKADTEQQLYDVLPGALQTLADSGECSVEVNGYRTRVVAADMANAGQRLFTASAETMGSLSPADRLIVDPLVALLPDLARQLPQARVAAADALWQATRQHGEHLLNRGGALSFVNALPCLAADNNGPIKPRALAPTPMAVNPPTHLLCGATARPLAAGMSIAGGLQISREGDQWLVAGAGTLNGQGIKGTQSLAAGDRLTGADGSEFQLIDVVADGS
ncbi:hypothetical protein DWB85_08630 [Seongchinamella sediminis]|uniref:Uncharacterized protein n=1 Tax=Seongchinamella sediminis TaxID=2283635 RepID=A0A3L7DYK3_9GAMM|nr:hypothetical protein [Seongchinamella sediminis]RLQ22334.1 hypothetical protein DWB85_08630 [Seongchinamella sediminis]